MIRILHSVSNMDRAGIETMLMNYYRHIDRSRVQFDFLCNKSKPGAYDEEILAMGGRIYRTPGLNPINFLKYLKYMKELFGNHREYKIIHVHNGALGVYALYSAKRNNVPLRIFHAHGARITFDLKWPLKMFCKLRLLNNCNHNWSCGVEAAKCYFGDKIVESSNYLLVRNAIEIERFLYSETIRSEMRRKHKLEDKIVIGHVGRFMTQKNHTFLIDLFKEIHIKEPLAVLVFLGDGELQNEIEKKVDKAGLKNYVYFMGNVKNVNEWYQAFDAFVLPSIWEGLPVVGVEAQAASLPCFFSTNITKEISITNNSSFISLKEPIAVWVKQILSKVESNIRCDVTKQIASAGYDIRLESKKLQDKYENFVRELL